MTEVSLITVSLEQVVLLKITLKINRFRILAKRGNLTPEKTEVLVMAALSLHNNPRFEPK